MKEKLNSAVSKFLRALSDELDAGKCALSDEAIVTIFDAVSKGHDNSRSVSRDTIINSLGKAYAYLSERTDALEDELDELSRKNIHKLDFHGDAK